MATKSEECDRTLPPSHVLGESAAQTSGYTVTYLAPSEAAPAMGVPVADGLAGTWMPAPAAGTGVFPGGPPPRPGGTVPLHTVTLPSADEQEAAFLGATNGHGPIMFTCARCGFSGLSQTRKVAGWAHGIFGMMTFGIGLAFDAAKDTHHFCPQCNKHLAFAKLM
mmetsp:Transcript_16582/g.31760  ORF Transcript_16582/g.31760 Transcript_16582/m.31760 type:complete len:165 (-) Transcript_16582:370-864(-)|eukprot:CAMPEP_0114301154 /NCGR_PEP_ID=MMETSP0059-20121206/13948_1 /TAXON_ID=36894 /ORGANISM="Pyramimonas parkeae, Strain CCMP726" /LENGTH=164 /DNA_ID=CAMNT_0001423859 /DNA_START=248 /DNA_END=742 /DNA_ORIENTATION=+